ncbi:hypothetical protein CR194_08710 [Salipaludibacillus keqinensis]|uniref:YlbE-like protein n=1 Tax=Salipaludibacillus keqinensis TaxID=2045207 RepID=A0A323TUW1_9BACI|nr:YlbE-like family protein [Salipaludibacillus keqinensis]PYZ93265.1 hypothetical protein CR194_08710 [Salipaludibacillus keqinensis]
MRPEVYEVIRSKSELHQYLRLHPAWYRKLGRDPDLLKQMVQEANVYFGKTLPQRMEQIHKNMNLAMMMIEMMRQVNET